MDYFDGEWAVWIDEHDWDAEATIYNFWFERERDAVAFALRWGKITE